VQHGIDLRLAVSDRVWPQREQVHTMYFEDRHFETMDSIRDAFEIDVTVTGGVLADERAAIYYGPDDAPPDAEQANI
jgi:tRNA(adenine34) deaminase